MLGVWFGFVASLLVGFLCWVVLVVLLLVLSVILRLCLFVCCGGFLKADELLRYLLVVVMIVLLDRWVCLCYNLCVICLLLCSLMWFTDWCVGVWV